MGQAEVIMKTALRDFAPRAMFLPWVLAGAALVAPGVGNRLHAQTSSVQAPRPAFEVASIRQNKEAGLGNWRTLPGGRFVATKVALRALIRIAYGFDTLVKPQEQILGAPSWIDSTRFDIEAKAASEFDADAVAARGQALAMLRTLLEERFNLVAHLEKREMPIYELVMARGDGRFGPDLKRSTLDCGPGAPAPPAGIKCGVSSEGQVLVGHAVPMNLLVAFLTISPAVGRMVQNRTNLDGLFDMRLSFTRPFVVGPGGGAVANPDIDSGPTIFTALQEQLGLKLEARRAPVDVLVIDRIEPLAADAR
jgi:uncharacterized protein (TIGR03435 family)